MVVRAEDKLIFGEFDVTDGTKIVFQNSVHIYFALAIGLK